MCSLPKYLPVPNSLAQFTQAKHVEWYFTPVLIEGPVVTGLTLSTRDSVGKFLLLGTRIAVNARLDELRGPVNGGTPSRRDLYMANVTACTNTYEYQASVPQRAGLEIRLMLPLCSCNDNHDVCQTVIVIDTDLTCQILSRRD
jgi:hypothetical protein